MLIFSPGPDTARAFRDALGTFATGVTVVTVRGPDGPLGMTANSFASVSLNPPLVLWSPARASARFTAMTGAKRFAVHVLSAEGRDTAAHFARSAQMKGLDLEGTEPPLLSTGWLARFICQREAVHDGGDHAIVIGRVEQCAQREGAPLVFSAGHFGTFSPARGV
ncbi:flavin reductase (DIM6/NTAB) family NADH-FMN oxidoreductase RutF [Rhodovulum imhoffii]|uniref:Flavin reductase (DIM6/NTAB) family NADH-FMN oxidoreductase RutF n=1 Tax=Rhodovulum imhoffii TaxID=365340 RepID=A0A2T5BPU6_9RHOB|nr:flavin reductase family protein [Rhodovulum imhoffii]PTN01079.1 flavin reductase (DIM6/NTAB) family NADH-FMN oxidoreductase RutF [Rhodovulum imhoffii]